jgi:hypothetical protein
VKRLLLVLVTFNRAAAAAAAAAPAPTPTPGAPPAQPNNDPPVRYDWQGNHKRRPRR